MPINPKDVEKESSQSVSSIARDAERKKNPGIQSALLLCYDYKASDPVSIAAIQNLPELNITKCK